MLLQANNNDTAAIPLEPIANGHRTDAASAHPAGQQAQALLPVTATTDVSKKANSGNPEPNGICEVKIEAEANKAPPSVAASVDKNGQTTKEQSPSKNATEV